MFAFSARHFIFAFFLLAGLVTIAYYPSLSVPFYLDDIDSIVNNQALHADGLAALISGGYLPRIVAYFTLWGNYQLSGLELQGYHTVNIAIHLLNTLAVFFLTLLLMRFISKNVEDKQHAMWAFIVAALWALHPLNSQPVIYVVQRLSSISALFMLLTAIFYIAARASCGRRNCILFFFLTALSIAAGAFSKQNYYVIFVFLFCWEWFHSGPKIRGYLTRATFACLLLVMLVAPFPFVESLWGKLDAFTRDPGAMDRVSYFYTQCIVLWDYIAKFYFPYPLQLDIQVLPRKTFEPIVAAALLAHTLFIGVALRFRNTIPLLFWGILFFYISHLVESFIFPIKDLAFEHRTYVGNVGLTLATVAVVRFLLGKSQLRNYYATPLLISFLVLSAIGTGLIYQRSLQWQDPLTFYERELRFSPEHIRTNASYGIELAKAGQLAEAEINLKKSIDLNLANGTVTSGVLNAYMTVLYQQQKFQQAAPVVMMALKHIHYPERRSLVLSNLAVGYIYMGYCDFALSLLEQALVLFPGNQDAANNRNYCLQKLSGN